MSDTLGLRFTLGKKCSDTILEFIDEVFEDFISPHMSSLVRDDSRDVEFARRVTNFFEGKRWNQIKLADMYQAFDRDLTMAFYFLVPAAKVAMFPLALRVTLEDSPNLDNTGYLLFSLIDGADNDEVRRGLQSHLTDIQKQLALIVYSTVLWLLGESLTFEQTKRLDFLYE